MPYKIGANGYFEAAVNLPGLGIGERLHGHSYKVEVELRGEEVDNRGALMDLAELKGKLDTCLKNLNFQHLNTLPAFKDKSPTCENIAKYILDTLKTDNSLARFNLSVKVWENEFMWGSCEE